jgi:GxxExxY protein
MVDNYKYADLTGMIIAAAMIVHRNLSGANFTENIFHRALLLELAQFGLDCESEKELPVYYKGRQIGKKRVDIFVAQKVLVELKANCGLEPVHCNQLVNYLKVFNIEVGLLLNFGTPSLQIRRFVNNTYRS